MDYKTIILIDDNPTTIFYNKDVASDFSPDAKIVSFEDPKKFIENLKEISTSHEGRILILLDINMPGMSGFELLEYLDEELEDSSNFEIIMVTSSNMKSDMEKATRFSNVIGYMEKPITINKLENTTQGLG